MERNISKAENAIFLIREPFNHTYNPAKVLEHGRDTMKVKKQFRDAYMNVITLG